MTPNCLRYFVCLCLAVQTLALLDGVSLGSRSLHAPFKKRCGDDLSLYAWCRVLGIYCCVCLVSCFFFFFGGGKVFVVLYAWPWCHVWGKVFVVALPFLSFGVWFV